MSESTFLKEPSHLSYLSFSNKREGKVGRWLLGLHGAGMINLVDGSVDGSCGISVRLVPLHD